MKKEAILHIPMSDYAHGVDEDHYVFRLRTAKNDIDRCLLFYGDTACRETPIIFYQEEMEIVASDEYFDYYEVQFRGPYHRIYYYFQLFSEKETVYYYSDFFRNELVDDRSEYYKIPYNHKGNLATLPDWIKNAVVYNIFPDSFATAKEFISKQPTQKNMGKLVTKGLLGGTIQGIEESAEYLLELGVNCIYINPIFAAGEYHKYDTIDYKSIDPCFGSNKDFKKMVNSMHEHGIRVIIDGVFNHCGWNFFAFEDVLNNGEESRYKDWFYRLKFPVIRPENPEQIPDYECFAYERMMPKLDTSNKEVKDYLLEVGTYWVKEYGIDGWRLDVASEVDDNFWRSFRQKVKEVSPDCFIIGEVWENARYWLDGSQFDSTMNYDLRKHCMYFFAKEEIDGAQFDGRVTNMRMRYRKNLTYGQLNLLDSHDVSRFLSVCDGDIKKWKLAVLFQIFFIGIPSIFYGDEQMFEGVLESEYRAPMKWNKEGLGFTFYQKAIQIRKSSQAFSEGEYQTVYAKEGSRLYIFKRFYAEETYIICLNAGMEKQKIEPDGILIWEDGYIENSLNGYGFAVFKTDK